MQPEVEWAMIEPEVERRIRAEARRIMAARAGVRTVLLAGSYARGQQWPHSDVDLIVVTADGPAYKDVADVDWTTFDTAYTTLEQLERDIAASFVVCNGCLDLTPLAGDLTLARWIEATARRLYPRHVPGPDEQRRSHQRIRASAQDLRVARGVGDCVAQAQIGGASVWLAGRVLLSMAGSGPIREDGWHDRLRAARLPCDAAAAYARWHVGEGLNERLEAAFALAKGALGEELPRTPIDDESPPQPPTPISRPRPDVAEAVEMHRLVQAVGFGKMAKAEWVGDPVRQASEVGVILWFAVPALLALGGVAAPEQRWWHDALLGVRDRFPFDTASLYARALTAPSFAERKSAALDVGRQTLVLLEPIFRDTPYAGKYQRTHGNILIHSHGPPPLT